MDNENSQPIAIADTQNAQPLPQEKPIHIIELSPSQIGQGLDVASGTLTTTITTAATYLKAGDSVVLKIPGIRSAGISVAFGTVIDINSGMPVLQATITNGAAGG